MLRWGPFELDPGRRTLTRDGAELELQPLPFDVLSLLARRLDEAVSREELLATAWGGVKVVDGALTQVVRKLRAALGDDPEEPRWLRTVPRFGYRLCAGERPTELVGRADELGWLRAAVAGGATVVTVCATGGTGKSALARAWLPERRGVEVPCLGLRTADEVAVRLAEVTGARAGGLGELPAAVDAALGACGAVLLDDADALEPAAHALLAAALGSRVRLHTARAPLGLAGEVALPLAGLPTPAAVAWLRSLVPAGWATEAELEQVVGVVGGAPLALVLVAGRAPEVAPGALLAELGGDGALAALSQPGEGRHDAIERCLWATWAAAPAEVQRAWVAVSAFVGPFSPQDAAALGVGPAALDGLRVRRLLRSPGGSLACVGPEQAFGRARAPEHPDGEALRAGWRRWAVASGRAAEAWAVAADLAHPDDAVAGLTALFEAWQGGVGHALLDRLAADLEAVTGPRPETDVIRAAWATGRDLPEARRRCESLCRAADVDFAARGWLGLAGLAAMTHDLRGARAAADEAVRLAARPRTRTRAITMAAMVANREGRPTDALALLLDAVDLQTDDRTRAACLAALAATRRALGDGPGAESALREGLALEQPGNRVAAGLLANLGGILTDRGELEEAAEHLTLAVTTFSADGDRRGEAEARYGLALVHLAEGHLAAAERELGRVNALERHLGNGFGLRRCRLLQGVAALRRSAPAEANAHLAAARDPTDPLHDADVDALLRHLAGRGGSPGAGPWARASRGDLPAGPSALARIVRSVFAA